MYILGFTLIGYNLFGFGLALMSWFIMNANGSENFATDGGFWNEGAASLLPYAE